MTEKSDPSADYPAYVALTGVYAVGTGATMALLHRKGRLPTRISAPDIILLGVATYQLSRTITRDRVTGFLRAPFAREGEPVGRGEVESEPLGRGVRRAIGELLVCPFCMTQWVGTGLLAGLCAAPRSTRFVASLLALRTVSEAVNIGHEAAVAEVDRMEDVGTLVEARAAHAARQKVG
jgi:hypothetical protein